MADIAADPAAGYWLTLSGVNGCGKSMLAGQLAAQGRRLNPDAKPVLVYDLPAGQEQPRRRRCVWIDERDLAKRMREGEYDLPEYLADDFFLVVDELGGSRDPSAFVADALARLFQLRRDRWTVITTNLTVQEVADRIDARVASRLIRDRNRVVKITAGDYALRQW